jgi:hypothetical protein
MGYFLHLGGKHCARRGSNPCKQIIARTRAALSLPKGWLRNWHMTCSSSLRSIVKLGNLRTALPILSLSGVLLWSLGASADSGLPIDQFNTVLARFNSSAPPAYRAFRRLEGGLVGSNKQGWIEVWTEYRPGTGLSFEVVRAGGHSYVKDKVLPGMLESEQELLANGKPLRAPLVARNYTIENGGVAESGMTRLLLHPARKSDGIVKGTALIEPDNGLVARIEGRLVKSPSFWIRDVDVAWRFARVGDAIVPIELSSKARVRFYGRSTFRMTYDYVSIDGRPAASAVRAAAPDQP